MPDPLSMSPSAVEAMTEAEAEAVLTAWVKAKRAELPEALAGSKQKPLARLAKRALYQLRSSGVATQPPPGPLAAAAPASSPSEALPGVLSAVLGTGERAVFFARRLGSYLGVYQGIISDEGGILQLEGGPARRGAYRNRMKELAVDPELKVLQVDWPRMKLELGRALAINERVSPLSVELATLVRTLEIDAVDPDWALPEPQDDDADLGGRSPTLHQERELGGWLPSEGAIGELGARLAEVESSPLHLSDAQKREQAMIRAAAVAEGYLTPERRRVYARRLWAMAELFEQSARPAQAAIARAEARRLFHTRASSAFIEAMFGKIVDQRLAALKAAATEPRGPVLPPPSGLVRP